MPNLPPTDDEQLRVGVDIAETQPAGLPGPQPKPIAKGEDRVIGRPALGRSSVVGQGSRCIKQQAGLAGVEQERHARRGRSSAPLCSGGETRAVPGRPPSP